MARVLIVDDDAAMRDSLAETLTDLGHQAIEVPDGAAALDRLAHDGCDLVLLDLRMPGPVDGMEALRRIRSRPGAPPVVVLTAFASAANTIEAMRLGAFDHLTKPIGRADLAEVVRHACARIATPEAGPGRAEGDTLIGGSEAMRNVQKLIGLVADRDVTVLITGETGTGKELVARAIHEHGRRRTGPFVAVNCAAIPVELLESELFGHVRGAFTGAVAERTGAFRDASGGTLFLDEIGDMALATQAKILRALQERSVTPVGGRPVDVNARVVAATHQDLSARIRDGLFRQDLYYRLDVVRIPLAPLRERSEDIVPLAEFFLRRGATGGEAKRLSADAAARLLAHPWPGNVRELRNAMERATVLVRGDVVTAADLDFLAAAPRADAMDWLEGDLESAVRRLEGEMIRKALAACGGNRAEAARKLNIHRQLLYAKMKRYGLSGASDERTEHVREADSSDRDA